MRTTHDVLVPSAKEKTTWVRERGWEVSEALTVLIRGAGSASLRRLLKWNWNEMWAVRGSARRAFQVERTADTTTEGEKARAQGARGGWCGPSEGGRQEEWEVNLEEFPGLAGHKRTWPGEPLKGWSTREIHLAESRLWGGEGVQGGLWGGCHCHPKRWGWLQSSSSTHWREWRSFTEMETVAGKNLKSETTKTSVVDLSVFEMPVRHPSRDFKAGKS